MQSNSISAKELGSESDDQVMDRHRLLVVFQGCTKPLGSTSREDYRLTTNAQT